MQGFLIFSAELAQYMRMARRRRRRPSFSGVVRVLMMMVGKYSEGTDH